jgi:hypothetical protein
MAKKAKRSPAEMVEYHEEQARLARGRIERPCSRAVFRAIRALGEAMDTAPEGTVDLENLGEMIRDLHELCRVRGWEPQERAKPAPVPEPE